MKMRTLIILLLHMICLVPVDAQVVLQGKITDSAGNMQPFVNVAVYSSVDSTKFLCGCVSDMEGKYTLPAMVAGRYRVVASAVGFLSKTEIIRLRMPSAGNVITKDFVIEETSFNLSDVVIKGSRKINYIDKTVYTFSKEQIKNARQSSDLLGMVEDLSMDVMSKKIKKISGGSVQILLNGIKATDNDLKMIPADKVLKVEYYNIPPARYAAAGTVVNVVTRRLDTGWNGGFEADHAFATGFGNDDVYIKRVVGNHQFSLDYSLRYRDYKKRLTTDEYRYKIEDTEYVHLYDSSDKFGYTTHDVNMKFSQSISGTHTFQIAFSPKFETNFKQANSQILSLDGQDYREENGEEDSHIRTFNPSLDVYFSKNLPHEQEIAMDLTGTYYYNEQKRKKYEVSSENEECLMNDDMKLRNRKKSLIGEVAYTKKKGLSTISIGYKVTLASSLSTISNIFSGVNEYKYHSGNDNHYLYAEYGNSWKKLLYKISIGESFVRTYNDDTRFSKWLFMPKIVLACNVTEHQNFQFQITSTPIIPTISQLSDNAALITRELLRCGNPYLHSGNNYMSNVVYGLDFGWLKMRLGGLCSYEKDPIYTSYRLEIKNSKQYVISTLENAKSMLQYGGMYLLNIKPFKNELLNFKLYGMIVEQKSNSSFIGKYKRLYAPLYYSIDVRKGDFGASYQGSLVSRQNDGSCLLQDENANNLQMYWQHRDFRLTMGCYWLFSVSKYHTKTLPNKVLQNSCNSKILDNKSMVTIGFSWNFSTGKKINIKKKIQNVDTDKGTF